MKQYSYTEAVELCLDWHEKKMVPHEISDAELGGMFDILVNGHSDIDSMNAAEILAVADLACDHGYLRQAGFLYDNVMKSKETEDGDMVHTDALHNKGIIHQLTGELDEAWDCAARALECYHRLDRTEREIDCLLFQCSICTMRDLHAEANDFLDRAEALAGGLDTETSSSGVLTHIGRRLRHEGKTSDARAHFESVLDTATESRDNKLRCKCLLDVAGVNNDEGNSKAELRFYLEAIGVARSNRLRITLARALCNLGDYYLNLDQTKKAKRVLREGTMLIDETGVELFRAPCLRMRARLAWKLDRFDACLSLSEECLEVAKKVGDRQEEANGHSGIGRVLGIRRESDKALVHFRQSLHLHDKYQLRHNRKNVENAIAEIEAQLKDGDTTE